MSPITNIYKFKSVSHVYIYIFVVSKYWVNQNIRWCFVWKSKYHMVVLGDSVASMKNCGKVLRLSGASTKSFANVPGSQKHVQNKSDKTLAALGFLDIMMHPPLIGILSCLNEHEAACMQSISPSWTHLSHGQNIQKSLQPPKSYPAKMLELFKFNMWVTISSVYPLKKTSNMYLICCTLRLPFSAPHRSKHQNRDRFATRAEPSLAPVKIVEMASGPAGCTMYIHTGNMHH